jgi:PPM family protein phosphatase
MKLSWGARTHRGGVRELNEDALLAGPPVFLVADGMGGHAAGEVASKIAVESLRGLQDRGTVTAEEVLGLLTLANQRIRDHALTRPDTAGMGTTATALVAVERDGQELLFAVNVGDSRLYRWRAGELVQVTVDHTPVQELVDSGVIDEAQAAVHPDRHLISRALGTEPTPRPDVWFLVPEPGDRYLLCTDGLTRELAAAELAAALAAVPDPVTAADGMVDLALARGGRDNVSVVVIDVLQT